MARRNNKGSLLVLVALAVVVLLAAQVKPAVAGDYTTYMQNKVRDIVKANRAVAPGFIRLVFHDCWVKGCDGSVLLERADKQAEMDAPQNGGIRGLDVIQTIKDALAAFDKSVTCADAVVYAAREACYFLSDKKIEYAVDGPGSHKDALTSSLADAGVLPPPFANFTDLVANFNAKGFTARDVVVLSGAHAVGQAHRPTFESRLDKSVSGRSEINGWYQGEVDRVSNASPTKAVHNNVRDLYKAEAEPGVLDNGYYKANLQNTVLFNSDWTLRTDTAAASEMQRYKDSAATWYALFGEAMARLSRLPAEGATLAVPRTKCSTAN